jgi:predicted tellurium resistance membrane protein TerC
MPSLLQILLWTSEPIQEETPQPGFGTFHVISGIHLPKQRIFGDLTVERRDHISQLIPANVVVDVMVLNGRHEIPATGGLDHGSSNLRQKLHSSAHRFHFQDMPPEYLVSRKSRMLFDHIMTLLMLTLLQAVLGFDNLLYISIESKRVREEKQGVVRKWGIGLAIVLRIALLFLVTAAIKHFQNPFVSLHWNVLEFSINVHSLIVIAGGAFVIYTAVKEIYHMLSTDDLSHGTDSAKRSVGTAMFWIIVMNLVFSFDSILSAIALAGEMEYGMTVMSLAIVISGVLMIVLADHVSEFLKQNRLYEVLGLFILFIVGIMLVSEGGHLAHVKLMGHPVEPMAKSTFYFVLIVLLAVDVVQGRYQRKLLAARQKVANSPAA